MKLKEIISRVLELKVFDFKVIDFRNQHEIESDLYYANILSGNVLFDIKKHCINVYFLNPYKTSSLILLKEIKNKFPNHKVKLSVIK